MLNVGLDTFSLIFNPTAIDLVKVVFPAPKSPSKLKTAPLNKCYEITLANFSVSCKFLLI